MVALQGEQPGQLAYQERVAAGAAPYPGRGRLRRHFPRQRRHEGGDVAAGQAGQVHLLAHGTGATEFCRGVVVAVRAEQQHGVRLQVAGGELEEPK